MRSSSPDGLPEALLLLAIDDMHATLREDAGLRFGLAGAVLIELSLLGRLACLEKQLQVVDARTTGDTLLDEVLCVLHQARGDRAIRATLLRLTRVFFDLRERYLGRLIDAGVLRREEQRVWALFTIQRFPFLEVSRRYALVGQLRQIVLAQVPPAPRQAALLGLITVCDLLDVVFSPEELRDVRLLLSALQPIDHLVDQIIMEVAKSQARQCAIHADGQVCIGDCLL